MPSGVKVPNGDWIPADRDGITIARGSDLESVNLDLLMLEGYRRGEGRPDAMTDIPAGTLMHRYFGMEVSHPEAPHVHAWRLRLAERIAYKSHVMRPFDELFGRLAF